VDSHCGERGRDGRKRSLCGAGGSGRGRDVSLFGRRECNHRSGRRTLMTMPARRRLHARAVLLDRSLEEFPLFRLSDTVDEAAISYTTDEGGRWRVLPNPGDRLPGTFDQDVYIELMRRYQDAGEPADGALSFTLHSFLRSMNRQADGRTYEQLRSSLTRLER